MPGYELVGEEELENIQNIFKHGNGVLFRHGFENLRGMSWCVKNFELAFSERFGVRDALAVSSGTAALKVALPELGKKTRLLHKHSLLWQRLKRLLSVVRYL
jgi:8-amino-3,8-dideoxy-alpha-D-manno-octulosonate transaminase